MRMQKFLHEAKGCIARFKRTKDLQHLTDIWRLAVYYFFVKDVLDVWA